MTDTANRQPTRKWSIDNYRTLAVTPAPPGWFAIYRCSDQTYDTDPIVAMLTQEYFSTTWYEMTGTVRAKRTTNELDNDDTGRVRVVFATVDRELGELRPLDTTCGTKLVAVATEREIAEEWQELFDEARREALAAKVSGSPHRQKGAQHDR
jgi:hypothetical protein